MTATATLVMQGHKRGEPARKQQLRLPIIAPKDDQPSSASVNHGLNLGTANVSVPPRARLPPRSRTGCWTCRTRKVKCDEGRPTCGQCTRLGHACDYSPRLSFRDDTLRVVERMQDVSTLGSSVWDSTCTTHTEGRKSAIADDLPPFATLTTDEDRERKAECAIPGTYNVVVNPESFRHLPEYSEDSGTRNEGSLSASLPNSQSLDGMRRSLAYKSDDPNVITLLRFEDTTRRSTLQWQDSCSPPTSEVSIARLSTDGVDGADGVEGMDGGAVPDGLKSIDGVEDGDGETRIDPTKSLMYRAASGGQDWHLLQQFRNVVWRQLTQVLPEHSEYASSGTDVLERAAAFFPPLFHAMMAVAALSLAHLEGKERLDALQHYQKALPALQSNLRSAEDLSSDGAFLTHYILLVYEIAAAESGGCNLWSQHLAQLLRISLSRREVLGGERFPFITWWICNIDLYALFSSAGSGEYVGTMLKNDLMPPPNFHLYPLGVDGSSLVYAEESETLPTILQLNYEVTVLAIRLGLLAQELRQEVSYNTDEVGSHERHIDAKLRHSRVLELQESLRRLWVAPSIIILGQQLESLPRRSRQLFEHAWTLFQACIIYSHTSMWCSQRLDTGPEFDSEIALCVAEILHTAEKIIKAGGLELRFIIFPLFMAGFASTDGGQKMMALNLITSMERESIGSNTTATRHALQIVYESQMQRFMHIGHSLDIHWTDVMVEQGLEVVNFGL